MQIRFLHAQVVSKTNHLYPIAGDLSKGKRDQNVAQNQSLAAEVVLEYGQKCMTNNGYTVTF